MGYIFLIKCVFCNLSIPKVKLGFLNNAKFYYSVICIFRLYVYFCIVRQIILHRISEEFVLCTLYLCVTLSLRKHHCVNAVDHRPSLGILYLHMQLTERRGDNHESDHSTRVRNTRPTSLPCLCPTAWVSCIQMYSLALLLS